MGGQRRRDGGVRVCPGRGTATAAGLAVVAVRPARTTSGHRRALVLLVASYAVWAWGLRANLRANQELLTATGTSTNVLSKAAHDLTRRHSTSPRAARLAAAAGYTATEVAKEVPYYAGAFGAAVLTDSVTATGALLFLAGANLGAAGYEYGLARLTTAFLRRGAGTPRSTPTGSRRHTWTATTARSSRTRSPPSRSSSTRCAAPSGTGRCCSSGSGRRCTTCSRPPSSPPRSTSATTCRGTWRRSGGGWTATRTRTTGARSSGTRCGARATPTRATRR